MAPQLVGRDGDGDGSLWTGLRRELGELFVVRAAGTKSPRASERLDRARRYLSAGQADQAIAAIEAMPGAEVAGEWLMDARRYPEARERKSAVAGQSVSVRVDLGGRAFMKQITRHTMTATHSYPPQN